MMMLSSLNLVVAVDHPDKFAAADVEFVAAGVLDRCSLLGHGAGDFFVFDDAEFVTELRQVS